MELLNLSLNFLKELLKYPLSDFDESLDIRYLIYSQAKSGNFFYKFNQVSNTSLIRVDSLVNKDLIDYENLGSLLLQLFIRSNYYLRWFIDTESFNVITDYHFSSSFKQPTVMLDRSKLFRYSDLDLLMAKHYYPVSQFNLTEYNELYWRVAKENLQIYFDNVIIPVGNLDNDTLEHLKEALADKLNVDIHSVESFDYAHIIVRFHTINKEYSLLFPKTIFGFNQYKDVLKLLQEFAKRLNDNFFSFEEGKVLYVRYSPGITYNFSLYQIGTSDSSKFKYVSKEYEIDAYRRWFDVNTSHIINGIEVYNDRVQKLRDDTGVISEQEDLVLTPTFLYFDDSPFKEGFKQPKRFLNVLANIATYNYFENDITIANELHIAESVYYVNLGVSVDDGKQRFLVITKPYEINDQMFQDIYIKEINLNFRAIDSSFDNTSNEKVLFAITIINPEYPDDIASNRILVRDFINILSHIWNIQPDSMESIEAVIDDLLESGSIEQTKATEYIGKLYNSEKYFCFDVDNLSVNEYYSKDLKYAFDSKVLLYPVVDTTNEFAGLLSNSEFIITEPELLNTFFNECKNVDDMANFLKSQIRTFEFEKDFERYRVNNDTLFKLSVSNLKYLTTDLKTNSILYKRYWTLFEIFSKYPNIMFERFKELFLRPRNLIESGKYVVDVRRVVEKSLLSINVNDYVKTLLAIADSDDDNDSTNVLMDYFDAFNNQIVVDRTDLNILDELEITFISLAPEYYITAYYPIYLKNKFVQNLDNLNSYLFQRLTGNTLLGSVKVELSKDTGVIANVNLSLYALPKGLALFENEYLDVYNWIKKFILSCIGFVLNVSLDRDKVKEIAERYVQLSGYIAPDGYTIVYPVVEADKVAFLDDIYPLVLVNDNS